MQVTFIVVIKMRITRKTTFEEVSTIILETVGAIAFDSPMPVRSKLYTLVSM